MPKHRQRTFDLPDWAVGEVLMAARYRAQLDLRQVSELVGIDWRVLSRVERGERPCRVTELVALANAYGLSPDRIIKAINGDERIRARLSLDVE